MQRDDHGDNQGSHTRACQIAEPEVIESMSPRVSPKVVARTSRIQKKIVMLATLLSCSGCVIVMIKGRPDVHPE